MIARRICSVWFTFLVTLGSSPGAVAADAPRRTAHAVAGGVGGCLEQTLQRSARGLPCQSRQGVMVEGTFTPSRSAASFSKAPHFAKSVPVLVRFSDTTGVPTMPDADPNASPHGIAIRFTLPDGGYTDIVSISGQRIFRSRRRKISWRSCRRPRRAGPMRQNRRRSKPS